MQIRPSHPRDQGRAAPEWGLDELCVGALGFGVGRGAVVGRRVCAGVCRCVWVQACTGVCGYRCVQVCVGAGVCSCKTGDAGSELCLSASSHFEDFSFSISRAERPFQVWTAHIRPTKKEHLRGAHQFCSFFLLLIGISVLMKATVSLTNLKPT